MEEIERIKNLLSIYLKVESERISVSIEKQADESTTYVACVSYGNYTEFYRIKQMIGETSIKIEGVLKNGK